jgi:hypothetical protein
LYVIVYPDNDEVQLVSQLKLAHHGIVVEIPVLAFNRDDFNGCLFALKEHVKSATKAAKDQKVKFEKNIETCKKGKYHYGCV